MVDDGWTEDGDGDPFPISALADGTPAIGDATHTLDTADHGVAIPYDGAIDRDSPGTSALDGGAPRLAAARRRVAELLVLAALGCAPSPPVLTGATTGYPLGWVPAGTFSMGIDRPSRRPDHDLAHPVTLTRGYWLGLREVTQAEWAEVLGEDPVLARCGDWQRARIDGPELPVLCTTWCEAIAFAVRMSERDGLGRAYSGVEGCAEHPERVRWDPTADGYRLPTEAEWERAAALGLRDAESPCDVGNVADQRAPWLGLFGETHAGCDDGHAGLARAGTFPPDRLGRSDLLGNASEWVWDGYLPYPEGAAADPAGAPPLEAEGHGYRGLSFYDDPGPRWPRFVAVRQTTEWVGETGPGVRLARGPYGGAAPLE